MTELTIYEKLSSIQQELKAPKNQYNSFGKYHYRNCEDILEAVKPLCNKYKTTLMISDEIQTFGNRIYVMAVAKLYDWDSDGSICATAYARESETKKGMDDSQITGSTSSYARKYALNGLFNIDDTKDADTGVIDSHTTKSKEDESVIQNIIACINSLVDEFNVDIKGDAFQQTMKKNINSNTLIIDELSSDNLRKYANELVKALNNKRNKAKEQANAAK